MFYKKRHILDSSILYIPFCLQYIQFTGNSPLGLHVFIKYVKFFVNFYMFLNQHIFIRGVILKHFKNNLSFFPKTPNCFKTNGSNDFHFFFQKQVLRFMHGSKSIRNLKVYLFSNSYNLVKTIFQKMKANFFQNRLHGKWN